MDNNITRKFEYMHQGSFTIEATIYVPVMLMLFMTVLSSGICFFEESKVREENRAITGLDIVQEFYVYKILGEIGEEVFGD